MLGERLHQLGEALAELDKRTGAVRGSHAPPPVGVGLAVRGPRGHLRGVFGSQPPKAVRTARCAAGAGCVAALEVATASGNKARRLWLIQTVDARTVYGGLLLAALDPLS